MDTKILPMCEDYLLLLVVNDFVKSALGQDADGTKCAAIVLIQAFNKSPELLEDLLDEIKNLSSWRSNTKRWERIRELKLRILNLNKYSEDKNEIHRTN